VGAIWAIAPLKPTKVPFFHEFVQFGKTIDCQLKLDCQILLKSLPLNLRAGSDPGLGMLLTDDKLYFRKNCF